MKDVMMVTVHGSEWSPKNLSFARKSVQLQKLSVLGELDSFARCERSEWTAVMAAQGMKRSDEDIQIGLTYVLYDKPIICLTHRDRAANTTSENFSVLFRSTNIVDNPRCSRNSHGLLAKCSTPDVP
jgi:hypothetical protein